MSTLIAGWVDHVELYPIAMPDDLGTWNANVRLTREDFERVRLAFREFAEAQRILYEAERGVDESEGRVVGVPDASVGQEFDDAAAKMAGWLDRAGKGSG